MKKMPLSMALKTCTNITFHKAFRSLFNKVAVNGLFSKECNKQQAKMILMN